LKTEWCSNGRVFKCTEMSVSGSRPKCSAGITKESIDRGIWIPMRAQAQVTEKSIDEIDAMFGPKPETENCKADEHFAPTGDWDEKTATEGSISVSGGIPCTSDPMIADKGYGANMDFKMDMPTSWDMYDRNVKVAEEAIGGHVLEEVLKGQDYKDERSRGQFLQILSWFPGICGQKNEMEQQSLIEAC